ncbi:hypothetical protein QQF64_007897 [Cirrhinus molitorella]|uniref:Transposase Tc1-like domain-containing protein n=1 Tax=Cirrhinus molitorella TaxID=172907 RepID=A0ABR3M5H4_9TELE
MEGQGIGRGQQPERRRRRRRRGRGVRLRGGGVERQYRGRRGQGHMRVPDEIRATLVDHVLNHRLTKAEAGRMVQPNVGRTTVSSVIQTFCRQNQHSTEQDCKTTSQGWQRAPFHT